GRGNSAICCRQVPRSRRTLSCVRNTPYNLPSSSEMSWKSASSKTENSSSRDNSSAQRASSDVPPPRCFAVNWYWYWLLRVFSGWTESVAIAAPPLRCCRPTPDCIRLLATAPEPVDGGRAGCVFGDASLKRDSDVPGREAGCFPGRRTRSLPRNSFEPL